MKNPSIQVAASILAGNFGCLTDEARRIEAAGADAIHIDIMDGHFVPNLTMGPRAVAAINRATNLFLDVHLMIYNPFDYIERFIEAGADMITFHFEATENVEEIIDFIRKCDRKAGLSFNPETPFSMIPKYLDKCDLILLMAVHPGFAGQKFIKKTIEKIRMTRTLCDDLSIRKGGVVDRTGKTLPFDIQVDGGINPETGRLCVEAGANFLVSGSYLFSLPSMSEGVRELKTCRAKGE